MNQKTIISLTRPLLMSLLGLACIGKSLAELSPVGSEFSIATSLPGDQIDSKIVLDNTGGFVVWEGNALDGDGQGISAVRLNSDLTPAFEPFVVNVQRSGDQQNPNVVLTGGQGGLFIWESDGDILSRVMDSEGTFQENEVVLNSHTEDVQQNASAALLTNGNIVVVWESSDQDGDKLGVFGQIIGSDGSKIGPEFSVPQNSYLNQRSPSVVATGDGGFMVVWISEAPAGGIASNISVCVWARSFYYNGKPKNDEFQLSESTMIAANPALSVNQSGDIAVTFSSLPNPVYDTPALSGTADNWGVYSAIFNPDGSPSTINKISNNVGNDQAVPVITNTGDNFVVAWTGFGGEGNASDVYGCMFDKQGSVLSEAFILNQEQRGLQYMPALASTPDGDVLAVWSAYVGGSASFDVVARRFNGAATGSGVDLPILAQPFVYGLGFNELGISWGEVDDVGISHYEVVVNDSSDPIITGKNYLQLDDLALGSVHRVSVAYVTNDGIKSGLSESGEGETWGSDQNSDGLPDQFQKTYWGYNPNLWEDSFNDSDGDGLTNLEELLAGTNPLNAKSVLRVGFEKQDGSYWLQWDTYPGGVYQVQSSGNLSTWDDATGPRVANGFGERMPITAVEAQNTYRVVRLK